MQGVDEKRKDARDRAVLWRLIALLRPYRVRFYLASLALLLGSGVTLLYPQVARYAIDLGLREGNLDAFYGVFQVVLAVFIGHAAFVWLRHYLMSWLGVRAVADLRSMVFENIMVLPISWFHERRSGELVGRLAADVAVIQEVVGSQLSMALRNAMQLVGGLVLLLVVDWRLTLVMLAIVPPFTLGSVYFGAALRRRARRVQDRLAEASARVQEAVSAIDTVQAFVREEAEAAAYRAKVEEALESDVSLIRWRASFMATVSVLTYGVLAVILFFGGRAVIEGRMSPGELTAFLIYTGMVASSFGTVASLYGSLNRAAGATGRLFDVIDTEADIRDPEDPLPVPDGEGEVRIEAVSYRYPSRPDDEVLHKIDLRIHGGEVVALVGPSGAGKSTIAGLLPRFFDPVQGAIYIDGVDVRRLRVRDLRRQMAIVNQEPVLFSGTIADNISYGRPDATAQEIEEAARDANALEFIESFPEKMETLVGERGVKLSGGQKQRVAIARALLADPRILVLDEATSSLDAESEAVVQEALSRLMKDRTTLVIAHRLSTVRDADRICVVEDGCISASGTHEELLATSATYQRLIKHQLAPTASDLV